MKQKACFLMCWSSQYVRISWLCVICHTSIIVLKKSAILQVTVNFMPHTLAWWEASSGCVILSQRYYVPASQPAQWLSTALGFLEMLGNHGSPWQQDYYITTLQLLSSSWCLAKLCGSPTVTPHTHHTLLHMPKPLWTLPTRGAWPYVQT